jgi:hypothetical protein
MTSSSPSSVTPSRIAADIVPRARIEPPLPAAADQLHPDAIPFPFGEIIVRVERLQIALFERLCQHQRAESRQLGDVRRRGPPLQPIEQFAIRRREAVPDLLDPIEFDPAPFRKRSLREPRRDPDPQRAGDQLQQGPAAGRVERVEPRCEMSADLSPARTLQSGDDLGQRRHARRHNSLLCKRGRVGVGARVGVVRRLGPDQRHRFGEVADEIP